jgi:hypothetical protein
MSKPVIRVKQIEISSGLTPAVWVGALSFEQRCLGSLRAMASFGVALSTAMVIDYPTEVSPVGVATKKRKAHWKEMKQKLAAMTTSDDGVSSAKIHPYRLGAFRGLLQRLLCREVFGPSARCIIDITCLTKAHTLALASWLVDTRGSRPDVIVAYTRPEQYGTPAKHLSRSGRWLDTVLAPFELSPQLFLERRTASFFLGTKGRGYPWL